MTFPYVYFWNRMDRKGQLCAVLARGKMNSCLVKFEDGYTAITSRNAIRRAPPPRRYILSGGLCVTCNQYTPGIDAMMPPHDPSLRCESGKRNHCSCDICF